MDDWDNIGDLDESTDDEAHDDTEEILRQYPNLRYNYDEAVPLAQPRPLRAAKPLPNTDQENREFVTDNFECSICFTNIANILCLQCRKLICASCFNQLPGNPRLCVFCREPHPTQPIQLQFGSNNSSTYYKYLKYKHKYFSLKNQLGGTAYKK